ncbi:hypothetical protein Poly24_22610 [Rosistilla carotiformis]|uniref:Uncharacterized protein n=1 Tax=Rosistilla carotiformis TaxID=2528017 RepID=A0A518JSM9_9BACT|nr:hypothetical protein Poly24_22610 [Rosistilla carotiformis]
MKVRSQSFNEGASDRRKNLRRDVVDEVTSPSELVGCKWTRNLVHYASLSGIAVNEGAADRRKNLRRDVVDEVTSPSELVGCKWTRNLVHYASLNGVAVKRVRVTPCANRSAEALTPARHGRCVVRLGAAA